MELIVRDKAKGMAYKRRLSSIKKMTMELGMLCDIKVCMICIGTDGRIHTWPEKAEEVKAVTNWYKNLNPSPRRHNSRSSADGSREIAEPADLNKMDLVQLLGDLDKKIAKVDRRIEKLRRDHKTSFNGDQHKVEMKTLELFPLKPDLDLPRRDMLLSQLS